MLGDERIIDKNSSLWLQQKFVIICTKKSLSCKKRACDVKCDMDTNPENVGLYSNDVWMVLWTFIKTGPTTKMDLEICLVNVLRVDPEMFESNTAYAVYKSFSVGSERKAYLLKFGSY